jgi:hypothetical protein
MRGEPGLALSITTTFVIKITLTAADADDVEASFRGRLSTFELETAAGSAHFSRALSAEFPP